MASRRGPDNSCRIAITGTVRGQNFANVFHAQLTTGSTITQADFDAWTLDVFNQYKTNFQAVLGTDVTVSSSKAVLYAPGGGELVSTQGVSYAGTGTPSTGAGAQSKVISWSSGVYWRGGKPRTYLPGILTADLTAGTDQLTGAVVTALKTAALAFRTGVNGFVPGTITGTNFGFISFRSHNADRIPPVFYSITGAVVHPRVGSQRRRDGRWVN